MIKIQLKFAGTGEGLGFTTYLNIYKDIYDSYFQSDETLTSNLNLAYHRNKVSREVVELVSVLETAGTLEWCVYEQDSPSTFDVPRYNSNPYYRHQTPPVISSNLNRFGRDEDQLEKSLSNCNTFKEILTCVKLYFGHAFKSPAEFRTIMCDSSLVTICEWEHVRDRYGLVTGNLFSLANIDSNWPF